MNAYEKARQVERIAREEILPWLLMRCEAIELTDHSEFLQKVCGDFIVQQITSSYGIELKSELGFTGNFYFEIWSNRERLTPGWMITSRADSLFNFFVDNRELYIIDLPILQKWAFGSERNDGAIYRFPEKPQCKYDQLNDTWGRVVPIAVIEKANIPMQRLTAADRQLPSLCSSLIEVNQ